MKNNTLTLKSKSAARADGTVIVRGAAMRPPPVPAPLPVYVVPTARGKRFEPGPVDCRAYYYVHKVNGGGPPRVRHAIAETAVAEMHRLKALDPQGTYAVYRAVLIAGELPK